MPSDGRPLGFLAGAPQISVLKPSNQYIKPIVALKQSADNSPIPSDIFYKRNLHNSPIASTSSVPLESKSNGSRKTSISPSRKKGGKAAKDQYVEIDSDGAPTPRASKFRQ